MTETKLQLEDWLDDLCVRFIINLPREELESVERICFQVEEAQWFYEDFIRPLDPALPSLSLKAFAMRIFQHCPLMSQWSHYHHITAFSEFLAYKTRVPVRGAILLNDSMDEVVLVKGWKKGANWSFPRGKINKDEKDLDCAIREVYEETGFDIREAGLIKDENDVKYIEITMREQHMRLYVIRGVPKDTQFAPRTRKEISKIEWYKLSELPTLKKSKQHDVANSNKFYMVAPFLHPLKKWIAQQRKLDAKNHTASLPVQTEGETSMDEAFHTTNGGFTPKQEPVRAAVSSELPEVMPSQDVSSHLKRLLNIGGTSSTGTVTPSGPPAISAPSSSTTDTSKSNALLALLRNGSNGVGGQTAENRVGMTSQAASAPQQLSSMNHFPSSSQPFPFSSQNVYSGSSGQPQQGPSPAHPFPPPNTGFPSVPRPQGQPLDRSFAPIAGLPGYQNMTAPGQPASTLNNQFRPFQHTQSGPPYHPTQQHAPAPYQQTGDPQFAQPMQTQGPAVPPASKLPPPKLTSHSLALLSVFKNGTTPTTKPVDPATPPPATRKSSQHQDHLLSLLKGTSSGPTTTGPAELPAQPAASPSLPKQILQRPSQGDGKPSPKPANIKKERHEDEVMASATVSGPLKTPDFDRMGKSSRKANGTPRKTDKERRASASPITILSRPQSAKRDSPVPAEPVSRPPSQTPIEKAKSPGPPKPFQPQILRRSDKLDPNIILPIRTVAVQELSQSQPAAVEKEITASQERIAQPNSDRRPSQTAAQKELLLSLFGKSPTPRASTLATKVDEQASLGQSVSANVGSPAASHETVLPTAVSSAPDSGARPGANRVTSPDNKAFLLGFLEGVAKGQR
ncbi:hypothetical protein VTN77DRAFT_3783 [Rasamsonia byssochlamydoides]|uniref:uncharacterized protein n=1 Tax=Rasamsonia byssochlamydoides TaxID=89139 RepID=UPI003742E764